LNDLTGLNPSTARVSCSEELPWKSSMPMVM
jgi:hypothetical protein